MSTVFTIVSGRWNLLLSIKKNAVVAFVNLEKKCKESWTAKTSFAARAVRVSIYSVHFHYVILVILQAIKTCFSECQGRFAGSKSKEGSKGKNTKSIKARRKKNQFPQEKRSCRCGLTTDDSSSREAWKAEKNCYRHSWGGTVEQRSGITHLSIFSSTIPPYYLRLIRVSMRAFQNKTNSSLNLKRINSFSEELFIETTISSHDFFFKKRFSR